MFVCLRKDEVELSLPKVNFAIPLPPNNTKINKQAKNEDVKYMEKNKT